MALTITSADLTVMSDLSLPYLRKKAPAIAAFATDLSDSVADAGTGVFTTYTNASSASIWATTFDSGNDTVTGVTVTLKEPYFKTTQLTPLQADSYDVETLVAKVVGPQITAVLDEVLKQAYNVFSTTYVTNCVFSQSALVFNFTASQSGSKFLDLSGSSTQNVALLNAELDYALDANMSTNAGLASQIVNGNPEAGRRVGKLTVYPAYNFPTFGVGVAGVACSPDAVAIATRIPSSDHPLQFVTKDPATGLSTLTTIHQDLTTGKTLITTKLSAGVVAGRPGMATYYKDTNNP